jgi:hypothetical protein
MICAECLEFLDDYIDGVLDEKARLEIENHLDACKECADEYQASIKLFAAFKDDPVANLSENELSDFLPGVWEKIDSGKKPNQKWIFSWGPSLAAAAVLALLILKPVSNIKWDTNLDNSQTDSVNYYSDTTFNENDYLGIVRTVFSGQKADELDAMESELSSHNIGVLVSGTISDDITSMGEEDLKKLDDKLREISKNSG